MQLPARQLTIGEEAAGQRIDNYLLGLARDTPRSWAYRVLRKGEVRINGGRARPGHKLSLGDVVRVPPMRMAPRQALPGADPESLDVAVEGNVLRVSGERAGVPDEATRRFSRERSTGAFSRAFEFPAPVDAEHVQARYQHGVLHVTLPKAAEARPRQIAIRFENEE